MKGPRLNVIEALQIIASKSEHLARSDRLDEGERLPQVLLQEWQRHSYRPDDSGIHESFSVSELDQLRRFTEFYRERVDRLPSDVQHLMTDPYWKSIIEYAEKLVERMANEAAP